MNGSLVLFVVFGLMIILLPIMPSSCLACSCAFQRDSVKAVDEAELYFQVRCLKRKKMFGKTERRAKCMNGGMLLELQLNSLGKELIRENRPRSYARRTSQLVQTNERI